MTATSYKMIFFIQLSRHRLSRTGNSDITTQHLKKDEWKIFLRDKKEEWNKSWQYLEENRMDKLREQG